MVQTVGNQQGCLEKCALGRSQWQSDCPEGQSDYLKDLRKDSLISQGTSRRQIFPENPMYFPLFFRFLDENTKYDTGMSDSVKSRLW